MTTDSATWPDVAIMFLLMVFIVVCWLLAGLAEAAQRERKEREEEKARALKDSVE
jgi:hypothetical protein